MDSYPQSGGAPPVFDLSGGHPVLDFVNTLDHRFRDEPPVELLPDYKALLSFARQSELLDAGQVRVLRTSVKSQAAAKALNAARELREALATVLYGNLEHRPPPASAIRTLERQFLAAEQHRELRWQEAATGDRGPEMTWQWAGAQKEAEFPVWILAGLARQLMLSDAMQRVSACEADPCRWLFLDTSKNHTRRWCNMKICGNRMKARRFQARHAAGR